MTTHAIIQSHLRHNGIPETHIRALLNPNDKQDVPMAFSLLKEIWSLPPLVLEPTSTFGPTAVIAHDALRLFGHFAKHLVLPYLCVEMSLEEQLTSLSTAAHLAMALYVHNSARSRFLPNQTYLDIMITIKNIYFCTAKYKEDNPTGKFYIILLGTDRLETFFGLTRTVAGTDNNLDVLQLGNRASGLTEVSAILTTRPEWVKVPTRLRLPAVSRDENFSSKVDHLNPMAWTGNVDIASVNIKNCWIKGCNNAITVFPPAKQILDRMSGSEGIDMFAPLSNPLYNEDNATDAEELCPELASLYSPLEECPPRRPIPHTEEGDLEDAIAEEHLQNKEVSSSVLVDGVHCSKARALRLKFMFQNQCSSTDQLKCINNIPCFDTATESNIISFDSPLSAPALRIGNPIASLVTCKNEVFLAIGEVQHLTYGSSSNVDELNLKILQDRNTKVSFQILRLVPATKNDDPTQEHDWRWSYGKFDSTCTDVSGRMVYPLNPVVSV